MNFTDLTLAARRQIALYHLRVNPNKATFIKGSLNNGCGGRCSLGLIAEAFGIPCTRDEIVAKGFDYDTYDAYAEIGKAVGLNFRFIYHVNDKGATTSYNEVADAMEEAIEANDEYIMTMAR